MSCSASSRMDFQKRAAFPCYAEGFLDVRRSWRDVEGADALEGWASVGTGFESQAARKFELGDEVVVPGADEFGTRVGEGDFGPEHVEARNGPGVETVLLILELVCEELDGFLLDLNQSPGAEDVDKLGSDSRNDAVDRVTEGPVAGVCGEFGDLD